MSVLDINNQNFDEKVLYSDIPILVDFYAKWCGPCKQLSSIIEDITEEYKDVLKVYKVDIDKEKGLACKYDVMYIPTLILFIDGEPVRKLQGYTKKENITRILDVWVK